MHGDPRRQHWEADSKTEKWCLVLARGAAGPWDTPPPPGSVLGRVASGSISQLLGTISREERRLQIDG